MNKSIIHKAINQLKYIISFLLFLCSLNSIYGQTVLISPTGDGGFENGATLAANGWTVVNSGTNDWIVGTNTKYDGSNSAFISNDGINNTYGITASKTSHFYRDITVPVGETDINLSFYLKGIGETNYDRLLVYTAPTTVIPMANNPLSTATAITGATLFYTQQSTFSSYTLLSFILPASLNGTTFRLIFTWQNDASVGTNPPPSIDNISLISKVQTDFSSSSTFTVPNGVSKLKVEAWGAGGGGGGSNTNGAGGSGGGGGAYSSNTVSVTAGQIFNFTIGSGGAGGDANNGTGGNGTVSSVTSPGFPAINIVGGAGGVGNTGNPGTGGTATGGLINIAGATGVRGVGTGGNGGNGANGGAGGTGSSNAVGGNGAAPGGGGGGGERGGGQSRAGGSGANGAVKISWITIQTTTSITAAGNDGAITVTSATGGNGGYTYSLNGGTYQSSNSFTGLSAGVYEITVMDDLGLTNSVRVIISGINSWLGEFYDGINFDSYQGFYSKPETFDEYFGGGDDGNYTIASNSTVIAKSTYSVRYTMQSNRKGLYVVDLGSDDGSRLSVDGTQVYNNWVDQGWSSKPRVLFNLTGNSLLIYDFYENAGGNRVTYTNQTLVLTNQLSTGLNQSIILGNSGSVISGDTYGALPAGISLSGTGYQWYYSTSLGGGKTAISGATGATYTPNTNVAPFNTSGTYYLFRYASLTSANNTGVTNYIATNISNQAVIRVGVNGISTSTSSLTGFIYVYDNGPSTEQSFAVSGFGLSGDIRISPSASYEISTAAGSGFRSVPLIVDGASTTTIYVRLKKSLDIGTYNSQEIVISSTGFADKKVVCSGKVIGQTIIIGFKSGTTTDNYYGMGGLRRSFADDKLTNLANFGPNGISPYTFVLYDFGADAITEASLNANGVQILDMGLNNYDAGYGNTITSYTTSEINEINNWTARTRDHVVLAFQGATSALGGTEYATDGTGNQNPNFIVDKGQKVFNGPFPVPGGNSYYQGGAYQGSYSAFPSSACILTETTNGRATGLINITTGDIYLADVGFIDQVDNDNTRDELTQTANITSQTNAFYANLYHSMARIVQYMPADICDFFSCGAGVIAPVLSASYTSVSCATQTVNINNLSVNSPPGTSTLVWFNNPNHTGTAYATPNAAVVGTYYAFYYNATDNCYSPASLPLIVQTGIVLNTTTLSGFNYVAGAGPSEAQVFNVSGSCLSNDVTIKVPTNYEMSLDGTSYQSTDIVLSQIAGSVDLTNVYVRLKAGLVANAYTGNISASSPSAATKYIDVLGSVTSVTNCTSAGSTTNQTSITYVQLNTISNASAKPSGYTNYSSFYTTIIPGKTYSLSARLNTAGNRTVYCIAWIDWNRDGDFADAGEEYQLGTVLNSVNGLTNLSPVSVNVPSTASIGLTKMRVSCKLSAYPTACEDGFDGEVEDYTLYIAENYWRGNNSSDWADVNNWTAGSVPLTNEDVVYSTGTPYSIAVRDLKLDQDRTIGSLTNTTTNALIIPPALSLTINNTITTDNNPDRIQIKSSDTQPNGSLIFAQPSSNTNIQATVEMYSKGEWDLSQAAGSKYFWQFFGIPIKTIQAEPTFYGSYVRIPNEAGATDDHWVQLNNASMLNSFQGYEITQAAPKTIYFQGALETGNFNKSNLVYTDPSIAGFSGQYLFANSYTAAIDIRNLSTAFGSNVEATVYLYNSGTYNQWLAKDGANDTTTTNSSGQYTASSPLTAGYGGIPREIPSMQAFLVKVKSDNPTNSYVTFNYTDVLKANTEMQRIKGIKNKIVKVDALENKSYLKVVVSGKRFSDQLWLFVNENCTSNYDNGWDGRKIAGDSRCPQLYSVKEDGDYQIDATNNISGSVIAFAPGEESEFDLKINHENLLEKYQNLYLVDYVAGRMMKISEKGLDYHFEAIPNSTVVNRFSIVSSSNIDNEDQETAIRIKAYVFNRTVFVENLTGEQGEAWLYDISGRLIKQGQMNSDEVTTLSSILPFGTYIIKAQAGGEKLNYIVISK